ncbi:MAG: hypothetical protein KDB90_04570 [Planctomycetes bacterium]|nr:hypothetical protein [Planctomycetota bacterium]
MGDNEPYFLLRAGIDCGKHGLPNWYYIAEPSVDRHWVAIAFAELEDMHTMCDLA